MVLPSLGRNIKARAAWSVSYSDASRYAQLQEKIQAKDLTPYENGNPQSDDFFKRMEASFAETERLRQHCRRAASQSVSRNQEEKVCLDGASRSVESARDVASFARAAARPVGQEEDQFLGVVTDLPAGLGHLKVPKPVIEEASPSSSRELPPPGALLGDASAPPQRAPEAPPAQPPRLEAAPLPALEEVAPPPPLPPAPEASERSPPRAASRPTSRPASQPASRPSTSRRASEEEKALGPQEIEALKEKKVGRSSPGSSASSDFASSSGLEEDVDSSNGGWPPRPPLLRFKMRLQFSSRFKPSDEKALFEQVNTDVSKKMLETERREVQDMVIGWINQFFQFTITTEFEIEVGFPIIVLTMLDAIYPKRVRWREVDWRMQYKVALQKNYLVLQSIWGEVNMDKAREFRYSSLHLEDMAVAEVRQKLDFLRLMQNWCHNRIHTAPPYDAMAKRREYVEQCRVWGHRIKFPHWIRFDKDAPATRPSLQPSVYDKKPEYERLIYFLGSTEHQMM